MSLVNTNIKTVQNGCQIDLLEFFYPIGSIYLSLNSSFNPNTTWGGTWVQLSNFLYPTSDSSCLGCSGGSSTITLTSDNIPLRSHYHSYCPTGIVCSGGLHNHNIYSNIYSATYTTTKPSTTCESVYCYSPQKYFFCSYYICPSGYSSRCYYLCKISSTSVTGVSKTNCNDHTGTHSHTFVGCLENTCIASCSGTSTFSIIPPCTYVFAWRRTA